MSHEDRSANPQLEDPSRLSALIAKAVVRIGEFSPDMIDGATALLFLDFANLVIEDVRGHPYWTGDLAQPLPYYKTIEDTRPIADNIVVAGLAFYYALQQESDRLATFQQIYTRALNTTLWNMLNGNTKIMMRAPDSAVQTDPINGKPIEDDDEVETT